MAFLVALEGIDGAGKGTQARLLHEALQANGFRTALLTFPQYAQTAFGRQIGKFLDGQFGSLEDIHPVLFSILFAGDRFESKTKVQTALDNNDILIIDRYISSNQAHQGARLSPAQRQDFLEWIQHIELKVFGMPQPDLQILLDVPATEAQVRIAMKSARDYTDQTADIQESNAGYLDSVQLMYRELTRMNDNWHIVSCHNPVDNLLRDIADIHSEILHNVQLAYTQCIA
jgi:dTMP kinase